MDAVTSTRYSAFHRRNSPGSQTCPNCTRTSVLCPASIGRTRAPRVNSSRESGRIASRIMPTACPQPGLLSATALPKVWWRKLRRVQAALFRSQWQGTMGIWALTPDVIYGLTTVEAPPLSQFFITRQATKETITTIYRLQCTLSCETSVVWL